MSYRRIIYNQAGEPIGEETISEESEYISRQEANVEIYRKEIIKRAKFLDELYAELHSSEDLTSERRKYLQDEIEEQELTIQARHEDISDIENGNY